jgi:hypothetical protein
MRIVKMIFSAIMVALVMYCIFSVPLIIASQFVFDWRNYLIALLVPVITNYFSDIPMNITYPTITCLTMALLFLTNLSVIQVSVSVITCCYCFIMYSYI